MLSYAYQCINSCQASVQFCMAGVIITVNRHQSHLQLHPVADPDLLAGGGESPPTFFLPSYICERAPKARDLGPNSRTTGGAQRRRSFGGVGPGGGRPLP